MENEKGKSNETEAAKMLEYLNKQYKKYDSIIILSLNASQKVVIENMIYNKYHKIADLIGEGKNCFKKSRKISKGMKHNLLSSQLDMTKTARTWINIRW